MQSLLLLCHYPLGALWRVLELGKTASVVSSPTGQVMRSDLDMQAPDWLIKGSWLPMVCLDNFTEAWQARAGACGLMD